MTGSYPSRGSVIKITIANVYLVLSMCGHHPEDMAIFIIILQSSCLTIPLHRRTHTEAERLRNLPGATMLASLRAGICVLI